MTRGSLIVRFIGSEILLKGNLFTKPAPGPTILPLNSRGMDLPIQTQMEHRFLYRFKVCEPAITCTKAVLHVYLKGSAIYVFGDKSNGGSSIHYVGPLPCLLFFSYLQIMVYFPSPSITRAP